MHSFGKKVIIIKDSIWMNGMSAIGEEESKKPSVKDVYIRRALEASHAQGRGMSFVISEFIEYSLHPFDTFFLDIFVNHFEDGSMVYVMEELFEYFEFNTTEEYRKKQFFVSLLKQFVKGVDYLHLTCTQYKVFFQRNSKACYPLPSDSKGNKTKHILVSIDCLKRVLLMGAKSNRIRENFIIVYDLMVRYWRYQCCFYAIKFEDQLAAVREMPHVRETRRMLALQDLEERLAERRRIGVVYFITDGEYIKIGYAYDLKERLIALQIGSSRVLRVVRSFFSMYPYEEEQLLHQKYKASHVRGEWFKLQLE
jgi:hypothetical protein